MVARLCGCGYAGAIVLVWVCWCDYVGAIVFVREYDGATMLVALCWCEYVAEYENWSTRLG